MGYSANGFVFYGLEIDRSTSYNVNHRDYLEILGYDLEEFTFDKHGHVDNEDGEFCVEGSEIIESLEEHHDINVVYPNYGEEAYISFGYIGNSWDSIEEVEMHRVEEIENQEDNEILDMLHEISHNDATWYVRSKFC